MKRIKVRPKTKDLIVLDDLNRKIAYEDKGVEVNYTPMIGRYIKEGDLEIVGAKKKTNTKKEG